MTSLASCSSVDHQLGVDFHHVLLGVDFHHVLLGVDFHHVLLGVDFHHVLLGVDFHHVLLGVDFISVDTHANRRNEFFGCILHCVVGGESAF